MRENFFKKYRKIVILLLILNFLFTGSAFGQVISWGVSEDDSEIFPFSADFEETAPEDTERTIDYSDDLYEVTDVGILDSSGNFIDSASADEPDLPSKPIEKEVTEEDVYEAYKESIMLNWGGKKAYTERRLEGIKSNLQAEKENFTKLEEEINDLEKQLEPIH